MHSSPRARKRVYFCFQGHVEPLHHQRRFIAFWGNGGTTFLDSERIAFIALRSSPILYNFYFSMLSEKCSPVPPKVRKPLIIKALRTGEHFCFLFPRSPVLGGMGGTSGGTLFSGAPPLSCAFWMVTFSPRPAATEEDIVSGDYALKEVECQGSPAEYG